MILRKNIGNFYIVELEYSMKKLVFNALDIK